MFPYIFVYNLYAVITMRRDRIARRISSGVEICIYYMQWGWILARGRCNEPRFSRQSSYASDTIDSMSIREERPKGTRTRRQSSGAVSDVVLSNRSWQNTVHGLPLLP